MSSSQATTDAGIQLIVPGSGSKRTNIVFIHGSNEDATTAWTFSESGTFWPHSLSRHHGYARAQLWSFDYTTPSATFDDVNTFRSQAELLADALVKMNNDNDSGATVILVGRGLGGLIAQFACIMADAGEDIEDIYWDLITFNVSSSEHHSPPGTSVLAEEADHQSSISKLWREIETQFKVLLEQPYSSRHTSSYHIPMKSSPKADGRNEILNDRQIISDARDGRQTAVKSLETSVHDNKPNESDIAQLKNENDPEFVKFVEILKKCLRSASTTEIILYEKRTGQDFFG
ncbi:hypothetical protein G7054_g10436 [Neopestalotiopsis clavispora]|nr:hypothetical protein G7054_g10436 [Neopestalotiopsis clavispora]